MECCPLISHVDLKTQVQLTGALRDHVDILGNKWDIGAAGTWDFLLARTGTTRVK